MRIFKNYDLISGILVSAFFSFYVIYNNFFSPILALMFSVTIMFYAVAAIKQKNLLSEMKQEAEQKDCYVASVIHDLKNSLIAQCRILENLLKGKTHFDIHNQMLCSMRLLLEMVMQVTNTYKYSAGKINFQMEEVNIREMIFDVCTELTYLTEEEKLLEINIQSIDDIIDADKMHIRRVLSNLISNAIKYRRENTKIIINSVIKKSFFIFSVTNSGYHISPKEQHDLFEKYIMKNSCFNSVSTGLGLYLSKIIVEGHGGKMFVNSEENGINTFGFSIPQSVLRTKKTFANIPVSR